MAIQNDSTLLCKGDLKAYHESIAPYLGGNLMISTNVSDYYSEDEKIVGVWTNGKPLYQKTVSFTSLSSGQNPYQHNIQNAEYINFVPNASYIKAWGNTWCIYGASPTNSNYIANILDVSPVVVDVNIGSVIVANSTEMIITFQYTKTTDTASSALTTPGCYGINRPDLWPANKEIFFGNGLYGQRITGTESLTANVRKDIRINNKECQLKAFGGWVKPDGGTWMINFPYYWNNENYISTAQIYSNIATSPYAGLMLFFKSNQTQTTIYDIWVTYTK